MAREGQILGDPSKDSLVRVTNGLLFSYPGYNELLTGAADSRIDSNDKVTNPNLNVLEWLNGRPGFEGRVAAFEDHVASAGRQLEALLGQLGSLGAFLAQDPAGTPPASEEPRP